MSENDPILMKTIITQRKTPVNQQDLISQNSTVLIKKLKPTKKALRKTTANHQKQPMQ